MARHLLDDLRQRTIRRRPGRRARRARGASLSEYALVLAVVVVGLSAATELLWARGEALVVDTGIGIATPRPPRAAIVAAPVTPASPPAWVTTTLPPSLLTYAEKAIEFDDGSCLHAAGLVLSVGACGDADQALVSAFSDDGDHLRLYLQGETSCLTGTPGGDVFVGPCGADAQLWTESGLSGTTLTYLHQATGLCLTAPGTGPVTTTTTAAPTTTTAAPDPSTSTTGPTTTTTAPTTTTTEPPDALVLAACDGGPEQKVTVRY